MTRRTLAVHVKDMRYMQSTPIRSCSHLVSELQEWLVSRANENHPHCQGLFRKVKTSNVWQTLDCDNIGIPGNCFIIKLAGFLLFETKHCHNYEVSNKLQMFSAFFFHDTGIQKFMENSDPHLIEGNSQDRPDGSKGNLESVRLRSL